MDNFTIVDPVEIDEVIGHGTYGKVFLGQWKGASVALKVTDCGRRLSKPLSQVFDQTLITELAINKSLSHPNLLQYFGTSQLCNQPIVVMELMHESLDHRLRLGPPLPSVARFFILRSVACGLRYLHELSSPIVHRYLSSRCVLLSRDSPQVKIADVGLGNALDFYLAAARTVQHAARHYSPPENRGGEIIRPSFDIFSYGILATETVTGRPPSPSPLLAPKRGNSGRFVLVPELERRRNEISLIPQDHPLRLVILECLREAPKRPTAALIVNAFRLLGQYQSRGNARVEREVLLQGAVGDSDRTQPCEGPETPLVSHLHRFEVLHQIGNLQSQLAKQKEVNARTIAKRSRSISLKLLAYQYQIASSKSVKPVHSEKLSKQLEVWQVAPGLSIAGKCTPTTMFQKRLVICSCQSDLMAFQFIDLDTWTVTRVLKYRNTQLTCLGSTVFRDKLYAVMWNKTSTMYRVTEYSENGNIWSRTRQLDGRIAVSEASVVTLEGQIFIVGGLDQENRALKTVWRYDIGSGLCEAMPDMPTARHSCSCVIVEDSLYVAGGRLQNGHECNQLEVMNLTDHEWHKLPPTTNYCCGLGHVVGMPLAVGGRDSKKKLSDRVEVFDTDARQWLPLPPVGVSRDGPTIFQLYQGTVIVVGGCERDEAECVELMNLSSLIKQL